MSDFKHLIRTKFAGKRVIAEVPDTGRNRTIRVFDIDSDVDVGMHDGVDSWIATAATAVRHPDLVAALAASRSAPRQRVRLADDRTRTSDASPQQRRRLLNV